jgi:hypothetical protein
LETLDKCKAGQAVLESMSPGELKLTFQAIDSLGHLSVPLYYKKEDRIDKDYSHEIKIEFQIDPTSLPTVRNELLELIKYVTKRDNQLLQFKAIPTRWSIVSIPKCLFIKYLISFSTHIAS